MNGNQVPITCATILLLAAASPIISGRGAAAELGAVLPVTTPVSARGGRETQGAALPKEKESQRTHAEAKRAKEPAAFKSKLPFCMF